MSEGVITAASIPKPLRAILEEWFIRYNPFYLASAGLTLSGAWQLSMGIAELQWNDGRLLPAAILGVYQLLLAVGAILVVNHDAVRPAVILSLVQTLFIVDPTFQNVLIALHAPRVVGVAAAAASLGVFVIVAGALLRALRLQISKPSLAIMFLATAGITLGPHLLDAGRVARADAFLGLATSGVAIAVALRRWPIRIDAGSEDEWTNTVARRASRYLNAFWPLAFAMHLVAWCSVFDIAVDSRLFIVCAVGVMVAAREEAGVWIGAVVGMVIALSNPPLFPTSALIIAALLVARWRLGMSYRLALGAVLAGWAAAMVWRPDSAPWPTIAAAILIAALAWRHRQLALCAVILVLAYVTEWGSAELDAMGRGVVLLVGGFALLGVGVATSLYLSSTGAPADEKRA